MFDVIIVGGGISGSSLLYQLSQFEGKFALLEKENDLSVGTTKANSAIVHAGYDPLPGTKMAEYNVEGNQMMQILCKDLDILYRQTGSLVVAFDAEQEEKIHQLYEAGIKNGVPDLEIVRGALLQAMEPNLSKKVICALLAPSAGIVNPWEIAIAQAEVAVQNGAVVNLDTAVSTIERHENHFVIQTNKGEFCAKYLVNAAGIHADSIAQMAGAEPFSILPNRGQYFLLDKDQGDIVSRVIFQCPTKEGKGVLVAPTVHGNLIIGPNAEPVEKDDNSTTMEGQAFVKKSSQVSVPSIDFSQSIRNFAGIRAASTQYDFIVGESTLAPGFFNIAGMKSPGLTAAPAAAKAILYMLQEKGLATKPKENAISKRTVLRFNHLSAKEKNEAIKQNPLYGNIVCRCENISEGEIVDALHRPLPPRSLDAVKRRCNPGMGRCQGGFCGPKVQEIISRELGIKLQDIPQDRAGMFILTGETKQVQQDERACANEQSI